MRWALLYCSKYVKEQSLVQEELDRVLGKDGVATVKDRAILPYTLGFLAETLRYSVLGIFGT